MMSLTCRLICAVVVVVMAGGSASGAGEPIAVEKMVANDAVVAIFMRNGNDIAQRWKGTALAEVMADPEFKAMVAPLASSLRNVFDRGVPNVDIDNYASFFTGEIAFYLVLRPPVVEAPMPVVPIMQFIAKPLDPDTADATAMGLLEDLAQDGGTLSDAENLRTVSVPDEDYTVRYTRSGDVLVMTWDGMPEGIEAKMLLSETLQRIADGGGIISDKDYALGKEKLGTASDVWVYVGAMPWLERNPQLGMMAQPFLQNFGAADVRGISLGIGVEGRGFRSRVFVNKPLAGPLPPALTETDLAMIPRDVLSFSIGSVDWQGIYDLVRKVLLLNPEAAEEVGEGIAKVEQTIGMSIRDDILGNLAGPVIQYATEPVSPVGQRRNFFTKVNNSARAAQDMEKILQTLVGLIHAAGGDQSKAFVRMQRIDRPDMTQLYPQSVLPAMITPTFVISKNGWLAIGFSAASALPEMEYFLKHGENVTARKDFTDTLAKMTKGYSAISYTDAGRCFGNGVRIAQLAADIAVLGVKGASSDGELDLPIPLDEFWGMDQGRAPSETLYREKLFGGVSVFVVTAEGMLWDNYSAVGPIPLPASNFSLFQAQANPATITILAGMLLPALARARGEARAANCRGNLSQIGKAIFMYTQNNNENYPPSLATLFPEYIENPRVLICPSNEDHLVRLSNGMTSSYRYVGAIPPNTRSDYVICYDIAPHNGGRNALSVDGHVAFYDEFGFQQLLDWQYDEMKPKIEADNWPGNKDQATAFYEDRDYNEE